MCRKSHWPSISSLWFETQPLCMYRWDVCDCIRDVMSRFVDLTWLEHVDMLSFLRPVHTGTNISKFVFKPERFSLTMSRVNMQIHSLTLDGAYCKTEIPRYTRWRCATLRFWHSLVTQKKRASIYALVKIIQRKQDISSSRSSSDEEIIVLLNEERRRQCRRYLAYIFFVVTYVCSARLFVFERPQVVFYCNFSSSRHVSKSANLIGRIVFDAARQTKKTNPRRFEKMTLLCVAFFASVCTLALCLVTRR